jgi:hypothetical protein
MPTIFAQHAQAGEYHLETRYVELGRWEWMVFKKGKTVAEFSGDATTLESAKKNAAMRVGLYTETVKWQPIGPAIEAPEE